MDPPCAPLHPAPAKQIIFPGGGIFFWWQAGVVRALQQRYDLQNPNLTMSGASAGSIACVMAACNVEMDVAINAALCLATEGGVFSRTGGLVGVWGGLIERWLHEMLPNDCHISCSGKVSISVTVLSCAFVPFHREVVNTFSSKQDLIDACLASVHVPFFLDGKFSHRYQGDTCLDGSLLFVARNTPWHISEKFGENQSALILDYRNDPNLMKRRWGFFETIHKDSLMEMFSMGHEYGMGMDTALSI